MSFHLFIWIGVGAIFGAWLRWILGIYLNPLYPTLPLGTLSANLLGGYLIGIFLILSVEHALFSQEIRLAVITGFLGSLTTFSTFSAETCMLLFRKEYFWAMTMICSHLLGSLTMTFFGAFTARWMFR